jgi:hypothetical protein
MSVFVIPTPDPKWPTLGPGVAQWMAGRLVFGPGDLRGQPYRVDEEDAALLDCLYAVYPKDHPQAGRRLFNRAAIVRRKGTAKSEFAAAIAGAELSPDAPVRCDGWRRVGRMWIPVGRPVVDPFIPMVAYTEEQSDELAFAALLVMLGEGPAAGDYDLGLERIMRRDGTGKAVSLASAPSARDGARTTHATKDETHRWNSARHRQAHQTMLNNLPKRMASDPWELEITTRQEPGQNSVAESTEAYARAIAAGKIHDPKLFFFLREASEGHDLTTDKGRHDAVEEATAESKRSWTNFPAILSLAAAPDTDFAYWQRVWCNRLVKGAERAFDAVAWANLAVNRPHVVPEGALITLGFDGSRYHDATALVACEVASGYMWPVRVWERPDSLPPDIRWEVPAGEVETAVAGAFARWEVWRLYADPPFWEGPVAGWSGRYGKDRVIEWWTNRTRQMSYALRSFATAIRAGDVSHSGDARLASHLGNAVRVDSGRVDDVGALWTIQKERPGSPHKIDAAMAACLAWEARMDAITAGANNVPEEVSAYETVRSIFA